MIKNLAQRLFEELQEKLPNAEQLFPKQELQVALQAALSRLNLVTREEFDAQAAVLQRTRQKLENMEKQLESLKSNGLPEHQHILAQDKK